MWASSESFEFEILIIALLYLSDTSKVGVITEQTVNRVLLKS